MMLKATRNAIRESLIVGESPEMADVVDHIEEVADTDVPVLIEGERGTGRERVARAIHYASARRQSVFVAVKAESIPRALLADELLSRSGPIRRAQGGTLLLKDISTLPKGPQKGLAKVLKRRPAAEREDRRSDESGEQVDVRILAASDGDLESAVDANFFDRELYDRIGARKIRIPPLRRRLADLPRLVRHFLKEAAEDTGRAVQAVSPRALERMSHYSWPGNVAELKDVVRKLVRRVKRGPIDAADVDAALPAITQRIPVEDMAIEEVVRAKLREFFGRVGEYPVDNLYDDIMGRVERPLLDLVLEHTRGNQLRAAEILGMNRNTLRKKLAQHGIAETAPKK
jgi:two-component system nitrogen regulation response regulator GlnG